MPYTREDAEQLGSLINSSTTVGRLINVCTWITFVANILAWIFAVRLASATAIVDARIIWAVVGVRVIAAYLRAGHAPNDPIQLYLDRVAWLSILFIPIANSDWLSALAAVALWTVWGIAAGLGRYWFALARADAQRAGV